MEKAFPQPISSESKTVSDLNRRGGNDLKGDEDKLTHLVDTIYDCLKLDYESKEIKEHRDFIENIVDIVTAKVGDVDVFEIHPKLPNGSFYQKTKIERPDEFDFLIPFSFKFANNKRIEAGGQNTKRVFVSRKFLFDSSKDLSPDYILHSIHKAVSIVLRSLDNCGRLVYRGQCDFKASRRELVKVGEVDPRKLKYKEVLLGTNRQGPCITLALGGPLCVTYVDLTFCIEDDEYSGTMYYKNRFILPRSKSNWIPTEYANAKEELDENHRKILMILKYCLDKCKEYQYRSNYNSHILKTLVLHHSETCTKYNLQGSCFYDVAEHVFRLAIEENTAVNQHITISPTWLDSLCNYSYPGGDVIRKGDDIKPCDILFTLVLYTFIRFMRSSSEIVHMVRSREALYVCLHLICKHIMGLADIHITSDYALEYNGNISKANVSDCISLLRDLTTKGGEVNNRLSSPLFPYPPFWPDPENPLCIIPSGSIVNISRENEPDEWNKWSNAIKINIENEKQCERYNRRLMEIKSQEDLKRQEDDIAQEEMRREEQEEILKEKIKQNNIRQEILREKEKIRQEEIRKEKIKQEKIKQENIRQEEIRQEEIGQEKIKQKYIREVILRENEKIRQEEIRNETIKQQKIRQDNIRQEEIKLEEIRQEKIKQKYIREELLREKEKFRHEEIRKEKIKQEKIRQENTRQEGIRQEKIRQEKIKQKYIREVILREKEKIRKEEIRNEKNKHEKIRQENIRQQEIKQEEIRQEKIKQKYIREVILREKEKIRKEEIRNENVKQEKIRQENIRQEEIKQEEIRQEKIKQKYIREELLRENEKSDMRKSERRRSNRRRSDRRT